MLNVLPFAHLQFLLCLLSTELGCAPVSVPVPLTTRSRWGRCWAGTWSSRRATAEERTSGASVQVFSRPAAMILRATPETRASAVSSLTLPKFNSKAFGYLWGWNNVPRAFWFFTLHIAEAVFPFGDQPYSLTGNSQSPPTPYSKHLSTSATRSPQHSHTDSLPLQCAALSPCGCWNECSLGGSACLWRSGLKSVPSTDESILM